MMSSTNSSKLVSISLGGERYLSEKSVLDFLENRARLTIEALCVRGTSLPDTDCLRGQRYEQETLNDAIPTT